MSGYMDAQALLKTLIATTNGLTTPGQVTECDRKCLDAGYDKACILWPGAIPGYDTAGMTREHQWEALVDLFMRFVDYTSFTAFGTLRDAVIAKIAADPWMSSSTYVITAINSGLEPLKDDQDGVIFQELRITIEEQI